MSKFDFLPSACASATTGVATPRLFATIISVSLSITLTACGKSDAQGGPPPAPPVSVAPVTMHTVTDSEDFSGRLEAAEFVELRPRISGTIDRVHFADGALVRKGDLLFAIDPRPFEAELARAESMLVAAKAKAELAQSELGRSQKLLDSQAVSKSEVDQLASSARTTQADIRGAEASVRAAKLNVEYAQVRSPIAGRVSRANVTAGNLVSEQTVLTTIAGVDKVYAYFDGSERSFLRLKAAKASGKTPKVLLALADEQGFPHVGQVDFVDNRVNPQTGAIRLRAAFDNKDGRFTPGLSAKLRMEDTNSYDAVMVPEQAIGTDQTKKFVYVVAADGKPQMREIKLGTQFEGMRAVQGKLQAGENIVVDGLQRVQPGMAVTPQVLQVDAKGMPIFPPPPPPGPPQGGTGDKPGGKPADKKPDGKS